MSHSSLTLGLTVSDSHAGNERSPDAANVEASEQNQLFEGWLADMSVEEKVIAKPVASQQDTWLSPPKAAEIAGVHRATMNRWCESLGRPFARKVRGRWRVSTAALIALLDGPEGIGMRGTDGEESHIARAAA